jgi:hypothetical protein
VKDPSHRTLTPAMRAALRAARSQPLRRVHKPGNGKPAWPASPNTLYALTSIERGACLRRTERLSRQGHHVEEWWITELGVASLEFVVVKRDPVRSLHIASGSTRPMQLGMWVDMRMPEPEAVRLAA